MNIKFSVYAVMLSLLFSCNNKKDKMIYNVSYLSGNTEFNIDWEGPVWKEIKAAEINNYMGDKPEHFPPARVKVAYDNKAVYVKFKVQDRYVRAIHMDHQDPVYKDSCVEFFFTPGRDVSEGYFNLEMNCIGTMLFHHQKIPRKNAISISENDINKVEVITSFKEVIDPEKNDDITWLVSYRIPFSILKKYHDFEDPQPGTVWRANFFKCADDTSHPHWLTWATVDNPTPDFHRPEFFGELHF